MVHEHLSRKRSDDEYLVRASDIALTAPTRRLQAAESDDSGSVNLPFLLIASLFFLAYWLSGNALPVVATIGILAAGVFFLGFAFASWQLPGIAFVLFAFVPVAYLPVDFGFPRGTVTPAVAIMGIWLLRLRSQEQQRSPSKWLKAIGIVLVLMLVALSLLGGEPVYSLLWSALFTVIVVLPALLMARINHETSKFLLSVWGWATLALVLFAVFESLTQTNPFAPYYTFDQHWSVYRVMTSIGHPLMNGAFFASTAVYFGVRSIRVRSSRSGLVAIAAGIATALTASRSGVIALLIGLLVGLALLLATSKLSFGAKLLGVVFSLSGSLLVFLNPVFQARLGTEEAAGSAAYREMYAIDEAWALFGRHALTGTGPGTGVRTVFDATGRLLENAALGSLIGLGIVGVAVVVLFIVSLSLVALKRGTVELVALILTVLVVGLAFPFWESVPSSLLLIGFGIVAMLGGGPGKGNTQYERPTNGHSEPRNAV